jgi:hypothetical protein
MLMMTGNECDYQKMGVRWTTREPLLLTCHRESFKTCPLCKECLCFSHWRDHGSRGCPLIREFVQSCGIKSDKKV